MDWQHGLAALRRGYRRRRWYIVVNVVIGLALLTLMGHRLIHEWEGLARAGLTLSLPNLGMAVGLYGANFFAFVVAWRAIVVRFGGPSGWALNALGYSYTHVAKLLPTPAWFLASRVHFYGRVGMRWRPALVTTGLETILHALAGLGFYGLLAIDLRRPVTWPHALALAPVVVAVFRPKLLELRWMNREEARPGLRRQDLAGWFGLYSLTWVVAGAFLSNVIQSFSGAVLPDPTDLYRIWIVSNLVGYVGAYTLGGMGILREFTLSWLLGRFYPAPVAVLIAVGARLVMTGAGVLWALATVALVGILSCRGRPVGLEEPEK